MSKMRYVAAGLGSQPDAETGLELATAARAAARDIGIRIECRSGAYAAAGLKVVVADAQALASGTAHRRRGLERLSWQNRISS